MSTTSCTSPSLARAVRRRRLLAAALALPLSLAMTGTALAGGSDVKADHKAERAEVAAAKAEERAEAKAEATPSGNGSGNATDAASGKPCAGCVGKADNKDPRGQAANGSDHNAGYECDRNQGIGKTNPAHTGCVAATTSPSPTPSKSPRPSKSPTPSTSPGTGADRITFCHATGSARNPFVIITTSRAGAANGHHGRDHQGGRDIIPAFTYKGTSYAAQGDQSLIGSGCVTPGVVVLEKCPDGSAMPAGGARDCPKRPPVCPTVMPTTGPVMAGCTTPRVPPVPPVGGGAAPMTGVVQQPATRPVPVGPVVVPNSAVQPVVLTGPVTLPVERPVPSAAPGELPFTGVDAGLLAALGVLLLLAGAALLAAVAPGRPAGRRVQLS